MAHGSDIIASQPEGREGEKWAGKLPLLAMDFMVLVHKGGWTRNWVGEKKWREMRDREAGGGEQGKNQESWEEEEAGVWEESWGK